MRIVHLIPTLNKGGAERFALDISIAQRALPSVEDVLLLTMADSNEYSDYSNKVNVQCIDSCFRPSILRSHVEQTVEYEKILQEFRPDVIHTHLFEAELLSCCCVDNRILYVAHCHDNMPQFSRLSLCSLSKRAITDWYETKLIEFRKYNKVSQCFIANSADTYRYFNEMLPARLKSRVELIYYGFDFERFFDPVRSRRTSIANSKIVLTMVASFFAKKKNQEFLIDVAACLRERQLEFELNFVGDGTRRPEIEAYAKAKGVFGTIKFHGMVANVEQVLWDSDIYVHSALYEPFGLVFLEAMAAGLPCIALDGKGNEVLIRDNETGYFIRKADAEVFADAICKLAGCDETYARLSDNAVAFSAAFDIHKCAQTLVDLYDRQRKLGPA